MLLVPVTIGIAMLRHHLFDIDLVINRTLVYGTLTAGVVAIYVLLVGLPRHGRADPRSFGVSLLAVGLIAVVLSPRSRLQRPSTIWCTASATSRMRWCRGWANAWNPRLRRMPCFLPRSVR